MGDVYALDVGCLDQNSREAVIARGHPIGSDTEWIAYNLSLDYARESNGSTELLPLGKYKLASPILEGIVNGECMYEFSGFAMANLKYYWSSIFTGNVSDIGGDDQLQDASDIIQILWDRIRNDTLEVQAPPSQQFQNVRQIFEDIDQALTVYIRENGDANRSSPATGQMGHENTCVHVAWAWLAYPFALVFLTILFFVVMVFKTETEEHCFHAWKSSPLALLYHGLDQEVVARHDQAGEMGDMIEDAQKLQVRLSRTDQGWKLATE